MHRHQRRRHRFAAFIACHLLCASSLIAADGGLGIAPGIVLLEDAPVGARLDLGAQGLRLMVSNGAAEDQVFALTTVAPGADQIQSYEAGYEPLPDASWIKLEHTELTVPAHGMASAGVVLDIPDRPELRDRHFMLFIDAGPRPNSALGAVLRVRSRVLIETALAAREQAGAAVPDGGEVVPGRVAMVKGGDGTWTGTAVLRNRSDHPATYDLLTLIDAYGAGDEDRRARFFGKGQTALTTGGWATTDATSVTLAPGAERTVRFTAKPPRALNPGEQVDEVLFVARRAGDQVPASHRRRLHGADYERSELLRLRYETTAKEPAKP